MFADLQYFILACSADRLNCTWEVEGLTEKFSREIRSPLRIHNLSLCQLSISNGPRKKGSLVSAEATETRDTLSGGCKME